MRSGRKVGMYCTQKGAHGWCHDAVWMCAVLLPFPLFVALHAFGVMQAGLGSLAWVVYVGFVAVGTTHRMQVREHYGIKGNPAVDAVAYCCCYCFAAAQDSLQCEPSAMI